MHLKIHIHNQQLHTNSGGNSQGINSFHQNKNKFYQGFAFELQNIAHFARTHFYVMNCKTFFSIISQGYPPHFGASRDTNINKQLQFKAESQEIHLLSIQV